MELVATLKQLDLVLYEFSMAALTNYHKLSGIKQQKFIASQFWRPEDQS